MTTQLVLQQTFPVGRFHATPWRINPFDDVHGEWPPSPWRLVRAVVARWHQWCREVGPGVPGDSLEPLVHALCTSSFAFHLPANVRRGVALRSYQPAEWSWVPAGANQPRMRDYKRTLVRDNYWAVDPTVPVLWFIRGAEWDTSLCEVLDRCLERILYFGRAESITEIARVPAPPSTPNVEVCETAFSDEAVPVLVPEATATLEDIERSTDDPVSRKRTVPPGARWAYATSLRRPPAHEHSRRRSPTRAHLVQFALGVVVPPQPRLVCRLTANFRDRVLAHAARERAATLGIPLHSVGWSALPLQLREQLSLLVGKDGGGHPLRGHRHLRLGVWFEAGVADRLLAWRFPDPFEPWELQALCRAAAPALSWQLPGRPKGTNSTVRLVPLDDSVRPPPGFDGMRARVWESVTPFVPTSRWHRRGSTHEDEAKADVVREARRLGLPTEGLDVAIEGSGMWISVHVPPAQRATRAFIGDRRGFAVRLTFSQQIQGPIAIGHSSHFGLGLLRPVE